MRATKAPSKMEIGRRPDRRTEVSELAHIDMVNNLATGKNPPREAFFGAIYRNITPLDLKHGVFGLKSGSVITNFHETAVAWPKQPGYSAGPSCSLYAEHHL